MSTGASTNIISSYGRVTDVLNLSTGVIGLAIVMIIMHYAGLYIKSDALTPSFYALTGEVIGVVLGTFGASYAMVKTITSSVHTAQGFWYQHRGGSIVGDYLAVFELAAIILYLFFALIIIGGTYIEAFLMWDKFAKFELAGVQMTTLEGYKFLSLGLIIGIGSFLSSSSLGDSSVNLLGFYDNYNVH